MYNRYYNGVLSSTNPSLPIPLPSPPPPPPPITHNHQPRQPYPPFLSSKTTLNSSIRIVNASRLLCSKRLPSSPVASRTSKRETLLYFSKSAFPFVGGAHDCLGAPDLLEPRNNVLEKTYRSGTTVLSSIFASSLPMQP